MTAPSVVQKASAGNPFGSATSRTCSFATLPTSGHAVVVLISDRGTSGQGALSSVTDNQGNTYALIDSEVDASSFCSEHVYWCQSVGAPTGTFTVTVDYASNNEYDFAILEVAPPAGSSGVVIDQKGVANGASVTSFTVTASAPNVNADVLVVAGSVYQNTGSNTVSDPPSSGYTSIWNLTAYAPSDGGYKATSAVETSSATWTVSAANAAGVIVTFAGSSAPSPTITSVNGGSAIAEGATGVAIVGTAFATGMTAVITQGTVSVTQTITYESSTTASLALVMEPVGVPQLSFGAATLKVTVGTASATFAITLAPPAGLAYVTLTSVNVHSSDDITATPSLVAGDQLEAAGNSAGTSVVPTGLTLNADATFGFATGDTPANFYVRAWDSTTQTWGAWALQTVTATVTITIPVGLIPALHQFLSLLPS